MQTKKLPTKYVDNCLIIKYIRENFKILSCTKAENTDQVESENATLNGGAFLGTVYSKDANGNAHVNTYQQVNPKELKKMDQNIGANGMFARHELTESYQAGLISLGNQKSSPRAGISGSVYDQAHKQASFAYDLIKVTNTCEMPVYNSLIGKFDPRLTKSVSISTYKIDPKYGM